MEKAAQLANVTAGIEVGKRGTGCVTVEEILERIVEPGKDRPAPAYAGAARGRNMRKHECRTTTVDLTRDRKSVDGAWASDGTPPNARESPRLRVASAKFPGPPGCRRRASL